MNHVEHLSSKDLNTISKNKIFTPIIFGISIVIGILISRPLYLTYLENQTTYLKLQNDFSSLTSEYTSLESLKNNSGSGVEQLDVSKVLQKFDRSDIISNVMFNKFTEDNYGENPRIFIGSINLSDPSRLPNGLSISSVSLDVQGKTIDDIVNYITYLTYDSKYKFTIEDISLPIDTDPDGVIPDGYSMSLNFEIYTYE